MADSLQPLIGTWHTEGEMFGDDGVTVVTKIEGTDAYEWLGPFVVHRVDVVIADRHTRALEIFEPYDEARGVFPTRAYDDQGGIETSTATVDELGQWTFRAGTAQATLRVAADGAAMQANWVVRDEDGHERPWMVLRFTRQE
jgi:VCBS repeat-containing protein